MIEQKYNNLNYVFYIEESFILSDCSLQCIEFLKFYDNRFCIKIKIGYIVKKYQIFCDYIFMIISIYKKIVGKKQLVYSLQ